MSLSDALSIAMSGLRANQAAMSLVSSNVANAETPGYVRKTLDQVTTLPPGFRPESQLLSVGVTTDDYSPRVIQILADGRIFSNVENTRAVSLQAVSFRCGPSGQDGCP